MVTNDYGSERILMFLEELQTKWKFIEGDDRCPTTEEIVEVIAGLQNLIDSDPNNKVASIENLLLVKEEKSSSIYIKVGVIK